MAKLKMQKIELLALLSDSKKIIDFLQRKGTIEIEKTEAPENMYQMDTSSTVAQIEKFLGLAKEAEEILNTYVPQNKKLTDSFKPRREIALSQFLDMSDDTDLSMTKCYELISYQKDITDKKAEKIRIQTAMESLELWKDLDIPLRNVSTSTTQVLIGTLPEAYTRESLLEALAAALPDVDALEVEIVSATDMQTQVAILCLQKDAEKTEDALRSFGFQRVGIQLDVPVSEALSQSEQQIQDLDAGIQKDEDAIRALASERENIEFLLDYFTIRADKYEAFCSISLSENVFYLKGYIPERYVEKTIKQLEEKFTVAITVTEPTEDEEVPVLLKNNAFAAPVEGITEMYSLPGKNDIDPNAIMAFFYYVFFGMMFSDAGYGLIMFLACLIILLKCKPEGKQRKNVMMYMYCGLSTTFWGIMFGSFFGDIINIVRFDFMGLEKVRLYAWLDPQNDLMITMLWCFLFGAIHLFVGVAIKGYMDWRSGDKFGAICDTLSVYLAVGGAMPICAGMIIEVPPMVSTVGKYCAIVGVALIILTGGRHSKGIIGKFGSGLYALYNTISGYLSDILSYSRLLALGLVTGIIGNVVNMMGALPQNKILKAVMLIVVFALGHAINFGINVIGAYVHTNRLQYVEFFSRFYEGGGRAFTPLKVNTKTFKFKEEIKNG